MAAPRAPAAIPPQSNWLTEWATRTPIVTRCALYSILPVSIVSFIWPQVSAVLVLNLYAVTGFQLWRFFTMLLIQGSFFILLFAVFHLVVKSPLDELQAGSLRYLARVVGYSLLIGVLWAAISTPMYLFARGTASQVFGEPVTMGLFPFIFAQITMTALADPTGSQNLLGCIKIPNRAYPWIMLAVICLLYFSIRLDLLLGVLVGHAASRGLLRHLDLSDAWVAAAETGAGLAVRVRMTLALGYIYAPSTELPADLRRQREEQAAQTGWGALLSGGRTGAQQQQQPDGTPQRFTVVRGGLSSGSVPVPSTTGAGHTLGSSAAAPAAASSGAGEGTVGPVTQRMLEDLAAKRAAAAAAADARSRTAAARLMSVADRQAALSGSSSPKGSSAAPPLPSSSAPAPSALAPSAPRVSTEDPLVAAALGDAFDDADDETVNLLTMPGDEGPARAPAGRPRASTTAAAADLVAMGFERVAVDRALLQAGGDIDRAILLLTEGEA